MARVVFFVPYSDLLESARRIGSEYPDLNVTVAYVHTEQVKDRAREFEREGCDIIIARGAQANIIKRTVKLPVIEFKASPQAISQTIFSIRKGLGERPKIGLIALANTIPDVSCFSELFDVSLNVYAAKAAEELTALADTARLDGCQALIGGRTVMARASQTGTPCAFLRSGDEAICNAFDTANRVAYAMELEKRHTAELDTMLNHTLGGVMQIDTEYRVLRANNIAASILGCRKQELLGRVITDMIPQVNKKAVDGFLSQGEEAHDFVADFRNRTIVLHAAPIYIDGLLDGLILTFQEGEDIRKLNSTLRQEMYRHGFMARHSFEDFIAQSPKTAALVREAKQMALRGVPVLLQGEPCSGVDLLAECIHSASPFHSNVFATVDCSIYPEEDLDTLLFGNYTSRKDSAPCMAELAQNGTLYLKNIETLSIQMQYKTAHLAQGKFLHNGAVYPAEMRVRMIASTSADLISLVENHSFRSELYYAFNVFKLEVPPLQKRRDDIPGWFDFYLGRWQNVHHRWVHLTEGAKQLAAEYPWPGGLDQINCVCERVVLLSKRNSVGEDFLREQIEQAFPQVPSGTEKIVVYKDKKAAEIEELLKKYNGNRNQVAEELGVSKTTLWRYMKKYGIGNPAGA